MGPLVGVGSVSCCGVVCGAVGWCKVSVMEGRNKYLPRSIVLLLSLGVQMLPIYPST
jgi:hypothetical protein